MNKINHLHQKSLKTIQTMRNLTNLLVSTSKDLQIFPSLFQVYQSLSKPSIITTFSGVLEFWFSLGSQRYSFLETHLVLTILLYCGFSTFLVFFLVFCANSSFSVHPQILVVLFFVFFSLHLCALIHSHMFSCHLCADDTQGISLFCITIHKCNSLLSTSSHLDTI